MCRRVRGSVAAADRRGSDGDVLPDYFDPELFTGVDHPEGMQVKFCDWPLYYFAQDTAPGDLNGQGVGGVWWLVAPDGTLIDDGDTAVATTDG